MNKRITYRIVSLIVIALLVTITTQCSKDEDNPNPDPGREPGTVTDVEGNVYQTVVIGQQEWMAQNLKTTTYRDGTPIEWVDDNLTWQSNIQGAYSWYDNDISNRELYGALYNWYAVTNERGLCPAGWRVPTNNDWGALLTYLNTEYGLTNSAEDINAYGNNLKSCWQVNSPLSEDCSKVEHPRWHAHTEHYGFDTFGFAALPGGVRTDEGIFSSRGIYGFWWVSDEVSENLARYRYINYDRSSVFQNNYNKAFGISVRCILE